MAPRVGNIISMSIQCSLFVFPWFHKNVIGTQLRKSYINLNKYEIYCYVWDCWRHQVLNHGPSHRLFKGLPLFYTTVNRNNLNTNQLLCFFQRNLYSRWGVNLWQIPCMLTLLSNPRGLFVMCHVWGYMEIWTVLSGIFLQFNFLRFPSPFPTTTPPFPPPMKVSLPFNPNITQITPLCQPIGPLPRHYNVWKKSTKI